MEGGQDAESASASGDGGMRERVQAAFRRFEEHGNVNMGAAHIERLVHLLLGPGVQDAQLRHVMRVISDGADNASTASGSVYGGSAYNGSIGGSSVRSSVQYERFIDWIFPCGSGHHQFVRTQDNSLAPSTAAGPAEAHDVYDGANARSYDQAFGEAEGIATEKQLCEIVVCPPERQLSVYWSKEQSELLGVSVAYLAGEFLQELDACFGPGANPDYYQIGEKMLRGPRAKGFGRRCPRDGLVNCSFVDALDGRHVGRATVMLSWCWEYRARTIVSSLSSWCRRNNLDPSCTFVWQCALCNNQFRIEESEARGESEAFEVFQELLQRRMRCIGHVLALLGPWRSPAYIDCMCCVVELGLAMHTEGCKLDIAWLDAEQEAFRADFAHVNLSELRSIFETVDVRKAKAASPEDRASLLRIVDPALVDARVEACNNSTRCAQFSAEVSRRLRQWLAQAVADVVTMSQTAGPIMPLQACANAACLLLDVSDWTQAEGLLALCNNRCEEEKETGTPLHATLLQSTGVCLAAQGRHEDALAFYQQARSVYEAAGAIGVPGYASLLRSMAARMRSSGHQHEAMDLYRLAAAAAREGPEAGSIVESVSSCSMGVDGPTFAIDEQADRVLGMPESVTATPRLPMHYLSAEDNAEIDDTMRTLMASINSAWDSTWSCERQSVEPSLSCQSPSAAGSIAPPTPFGGGRGSGSSAGASARRQVSKTKSAGDEEEEGLALRLGHEEVLARYRQEKASYEGNGATDVPGYAGLLRSMAARLRSRGQQGDMKEAAALYREASAITAALASSAAAIDCNEVPGSSGGTDAGGDSTPQGQEQGDQDPQLWAQRYRSASEVLSARSGAEAGRAVALSGDVVTGLIEEAFYELSRSHQGDGLANAESLGINGTPHGPTGRGLEEEGASGIPSEHSDNLASEDVADWFFGSGSLSMSSTLSPGRTARTPPTAVAAAPTATSPDSFGVSTVGANSLGGTLSGASGAAAPIAGGPDAGAGRESLARAPSTQNMR